MSLIHFYVSYIFIRGNVVDKMASPNMGDGYRGFAQESITTIVSQDMFGHSYYQILELFFHVVHVTTHSIRLREDLNYCSVIWSNDFDHESHFFRYLVNTQTTHHEVNEDFRSPTSTRWTRISGIINFKK